jgi:hypothetical protein
VVRAGNRRNMIWWLADSKSSPAPPDNPSNLVTRQHCTLYFCLRVASYGNSYRKYVVTVTIRRATRGCRCQCQNGTGVFSFAS